MEERKVAKEAGMTNRETGGAKGQTVATEAKGPKERRRGTDDKSTAERTTVDIFRASKKVVPGSEKAMTAESKQREEARLWAAGEVSDTAVVTQSTGEKVSTRQRGGKKTANKKTTDVAEVATATYVQNFVASQYPPIDEGVSSTVRLGRAFVSGALGRRPDDPKLFDASVNITECSVRLLTTSKKAKTLVSAPPPNSIDSEMDRGDNSDAHLSQSATDLDVHIELPSVSAECTFRDMVGAVDEEIISETPAAPGVVVTPVVATAVAIVMTTESGMSGTIGSSGGVKEVSERIPSPRSVVLAKYNQILKEIEASTLAQEELQRSEPDLASAASFREVVMRGMEEGKKLKKHGDGLGQPIALGTTKVVVGDVSRAEAKYNARQQAIRVTAAKSLLKEELAKANPSLASVSAFPKAAYGDESVAAATAEPEDIIMKELVMGAGILAVDGDPSTRGEGRQTAAATDAKRGIDPDEVAIKGIEVTVSDEEAMSVGDSDGETSDDFSVSGHSTSGDESLRSKASRKRPADDSPERESTDIPRRGFPGAIKRSEAGCRVHIPQATGSTPSATESVNVTTGIVPSSCVEEVADVPMDETIGTAVVVGAAEISRVICTIVNLPQIKDGALISGPIPTDRVEVGVVLNVGVATTIAEVQATVAHVVALTDGVTGRGELATGTLVSNPPDAVPSIGKGVAVIAQPKDGGLVDIGPELPRDAENAGVPANVELSPETDGSTAPHGVSFGVDFSVPIYTTTVASVGSLVAEIDGGDVGVPLSGARVSVSTTVVRPLTGEGWGLGCPHGGRYLPYRRRDGAPLDYRRRVGGSGYPVPYRGSGNVTSGHNDRNDDAAALRRTTNSCRPTPQTACGS